MEQITIKTFGIKFWESRFTQAELRSIDMRPALKAVAEYLMTITKVRFDKQGPGWKPLSTERVLQKAQQGLDPRILRAGGNLFTSVTVPGSEGSMLVINKNNLEYGSTIPYARTHQFGDVGPRGQTIPARPYIGANPSQREIMAGIIAEYITAPLRKTGGGIKGPSPGDFVTGTRRGVPVQGILSDVRTSSGSFMLRNSAGQFIGAYRD